MKYDFEQLKFVDTDRNADKLAVAGSDVDYSWKELQDMVESLTSLFADLHIPKGHPIIIYGHKEALYPAAMLACMNAGMTYIPMDKIYPSDRIAHIIQVTGSQIVVNCSSEEWRLDSAVVINNANEVVRYRQPDYSGSVHRDGIDTLQYIMFTSGSTGAPKGVQITRSSVLTFLRWALQDFGFDENDVFMNQAPFTFDVSLCDVLNSFSGGASLVLTSTDMVKNQEGLFQRLQRYNCSVWTSTPSFVYLFLRHPEFKSEQLPALKTFLFMGEDLPNRTCMALRKTFPKTRLMNAYGPTEATIVTTLVEITDEILRDFPSLPIGFPMPGCEILIDKANTEDKEGELILVGDHVSIGYFMNDESNAQKFFLHNGRRAFRTGDLGYYEKGMVFYIGRNDDQVKMHGFRIELNEISRVLCQHDAITDATTVALRRNNEVKKIISFVLSPNKNFIPMEELVPFLDKRVPYYMIPGDIVLVDEFPYSVSHKVDKNRLIEEYLRMMTR
jgi:D-alanine--poly(phosphoribitol) ligase subunit 1